MQMHLELQTHTHEFKSNIVNDNLSSNKMDQLMALRPLELDNFLIYLNWLSLQHSRAAIFRTISGFTFSYQIGADCGHRSQLME